MTGLSPADMAEHKMTDMLWQGMQFETLLPSMGFERTMWKLCDRRC